jgi:AraC-like DNA-binding protein
MPAVDVAHREESIRVVDGAPNDQHAVLDFCNNLQGGSPGLTITAPKSRCPTGGWSPPHEDFRFAIALVRKGAWWRRVNGVEHVVDANTGYFRRAGDVIEIAHFAEGDHSGTIISVDPESATPVLAEIAQASGPFVVTPHIDLAHRLLISAQRDAAVHDVEERTLSLISAVLSQTYPRFGSHARRATSIARRRLVSDVCEQLHRTPNIGLVELARAVHYSPFHLSRVFREVMGVTLSRYRSQLRVHEVLMQLEGADDLNRLAAEAGFADHSHMTRTLVAHLGRTPSNLRDSLRSASSVDSASGWAAGRQPNGTDDEHVV